jgi:two-component system chemotaxis response regulator CheB
VRDQENASLLGTAGDGEAALGFIGKHPELNLVLLDVSMPVLDGLETLRRLRREHPAIDVIMLSGVDKSQTALTMQALSLGALDFVPKPQGDSPAESFRQLQEALTPLFELARERKRKRSRAAAAPAVPPRPPAAPAPSPAASRPFAAKQPETAKAALPASAEPRPQAPAVQLRPSPSPIVRPAIATPAAPPPPPRAALPRIAGGGIDVIALGVSTGGPNALQSVIPNLPAGLSVPLVAVQHMPPLFTASLAERLDRDSKIRVVEAQEGMEIEAGTMYIAPGGWHLTLRKASGKVRAHLTDTAPVNSCRPSVDVLFQSVEEIYSGRVLTVILTGMGCDGAAGVAALRPKGAYSLVQDEATSVVWGMPGAVAQAGNADEILPLPAIAPRVAQILQERNRRP